MWNEWRDPVLDLWHHPRTQLLWFLNTVTSTTQSFYSAGFPAFHLPPSDLCSPWESSQLTHHSPSWEWYLNFSFFPADFLKQLSSSQNIPSAMSHQIKGHISHNAILLLEFWRFVVFYPWICVYSSSLIRVKLSKSIHLWILPNLPIQQVWSCERKGENTNHLLFSSHSIWGQLYESPKDKLLCNAFLENLTFLTIYKAE